MKILAVTVSEKAGRWFVSISVEQDVPTSSPPTGKPIGVDLGLQRMATTSDGGAFENPKALRSNLKRMKRAHRTVSRRVKGSNNRRKAVVRLARIHDRVAIIRKDGLHKATTEITAKPKPDDHRPGAIVLEDLNVDGMMKNHHLAQAIADVGLSEFRRQIAYNAAWYGPETVIAERFYPSSKRCSECGNLKSELWLSERMYQCDTCGMALDRDQNVARNLAQYVSIPAVLRKWAGATRKTPVERV